MRRCQAAVVFVLLLSPNFVSYGTPNPIVPHNGTPNLPPIANCGENKTVFEGDPIAFNGSQSYDPDNTMGWLSLEPLQFAREALAVSSFRGKVFAFGGDDLNPDTGLSYPTGYTDIYDPATDSWSRGSQMPTPRGLVSSVTFNDRIWVIGGSKLWKNDPTLPRLSSDDVEVYDPANDTWQVKNPLPRAPNQGWAASTALDETIVVVMNDGLTYMYNPTNDTWSQKASIPVQLGNHDIAGYDGKVYVFGGITTSGVQDTTWIYDAISNTWSLGSSMPTARRRLSAVVWGDEIFVMGGTPKGYSPIDVVEVLNPNTGTWRTGESLPTPRLLLDSAIAENEMYAIGGMGYLYLPMDVNEVFTGRLSYQWNFGDGSPNVTGMKPTHVYSDSGVYEVTLNVTDVKGASGIDSCSVTVLQTSHPPVADAGPDQTVNEGDTVQFDGTGSQGGGGGEGKWTRKAAVPTARRGSGSATLNGEIYFIGGIHSDPPNHPGVISDIVEKYNPANDSWYTVADLPEYRTNLGATVADGKIYAMGGNNGTDSTDDNFEYDPSTGVWISKAPLPIPLEDFGIASVNDLVYVIGGYSTLIDCYPCGSVYEYDPSTDSWSEKSELPTGRAHLAAAVLGGKIFAIGGDANAELDVVEVYDPATDTWKAAGNMTTPRSRLRAEPVSGGIMAIAGRDPSLFLTSTEMYDPITDNWTEKAKLVEPRFDFGSGSIGGCVYAFGGHSGHMAGTVVFNEEYCQEVPLEFVWDIDASVDSDGDGNYTNDNDATGPIPTHVYYDNSVHVVTLTVTDPQGLQDTDQCNVTVNNVAPIPEWTSRSVDGTILTPPYPEGKEILFEATVSDPGIYDTFTYDWDLGDGLVLLDAGPQVIHAYGDDKTYSVVLTVTDDDGGVGVDDTPPLPTTNEDPVPKIDLPFCIFVEGLDPCEAIGMFTDPGWLDTHSAVWDFGDGTAETAVLMEKHDPPASTGWNLSSHLYGDNGLYTITFTVTDDDGGKGTATAEVPVQNHAPSFDLSVPITVNEGEQFVLGVEATDPGSDDLTISVDWGDGTSDSRIYYNDGVGPDPPNSGAGVFPFVVQVDFTHVYPDDGDYDVTVEVEDDDGGIDVKAFQIPVLNVAPTVTLEVLPIEVNASLRIAGEKWHDVAIEMYEDGVLITSGTLVRYPGSPDDQRLNLTHLQVDYSKKYSAVVRYTPEDDPINGQPNGANPCWIILTFSNGQELWIHHTFNVEHPDTYVWEVDLTAAILMHGLTFQATAFDPGADDLTFYWNFGDGMNATSFYPNANGTYPVEITETINHAFPGSGTYVVVLTVKDDDGGVYSASLTIVIP